MPCSVCKPLPQIYVCPFSAILPSAKIQVFFNNQQIDVSLFTLRDIKLLHCLSSKNKKLRRVDEREGKQQKSVTNSPWILENIWLEH